MFFTHETLSPRVVRITDIANTKMYLVLGDSAALLIDTGVGVGDLAGYVRTLTHLPCKVVLTHGHVDHAMGAAQFDTVYLRGQDAPVYEQHSALACRKGYIAGAVLQGGNAQAIAALQETDFQQAVAFDSFLPLEAGDVFELGGITAEILEAKGHTPGCVAVLLPQEKMLLLGDACNNFTFLFDAFASSVTDYLAVCKALQKSVSGRYTRVLTSHGTGDNGADTLESVIAVCRDVLAGNSDKIPFQGFGAETAYIAKAMDLSRFCRVDGGSGNVVYSPDKG